MVNRVKFEKGYFKSPVKVIMRIEGSIIRDRRIKLVHRIFLVVGMLVVQLVGISLLDAQTRTQPIEGATDPRGNPQLTVCSQNLNNYGKISSVINRTGESAKSFQGREEGLVARFQKAHCDVIAVQEVLSRSEIEGKQVLKQLGERLSEKTHRTYEPVVGPSNDKNLRNGYLIARDRATVVNTLSYRRIELPKISENQKPRNFSRGPLELQLSVNSRDGEKSQSVTLVNFHFKSRSGAAGDPTGLEWETFRMEMAEALRRVVESRHKAAMVKGGALLLLLGDRNSNFDLASARILEGSLSLQDFQGEAPCRMSKRGVPLCKGNIAAPKILFSVLTGDPQTKLQPGTFAYKGSFSWLDEILMPAESLPAAWAHFDKEGDYDSGVVNTPEAASDHALVYVRLYW